METSSPGGWEGDLIPDGSVFNLVPAGSDGDLVTAGSVFNLVPDGSVFNLVTAGSVFNLVPDGRDEPLPPPAGRGAPSPCSLPKL